MANYNYIETYKSKLDWANTFNRTGDFPLDRSSMFSSYDDAVLYANGGKDSRGLSGVSYVGQIITVYENGKVDVYKICESRNLENISPIIIGDMPNSAVLEGEYEGYSNKAISQASVAVGAASTSGLKGWYYTHVNIDEKKIFLGRERTKILGVDSLTCTYKKLIVDYSDSKYTDSSFISGYEVGDVLSIVYDQKFEDYATITSISGNVITLDKIPFVADDFTAGVCTKVTAIGQPDEFSVYCIKRDFNDTTKVLTVTKHDNGGVDFGGGSLSEGVQTYAVNIGAHAEGGQTVAKGQYSHVEGLRTIANYAAHAEGRETVALGAQAHSEGNGTQALGGSSHAEGRDTIAKSNYSHAEGRLSQANNSHSHAEGYDTRANGVTSHAEGEYTTAYGQASHSEGIKTNAYGKNSHAEGFSSNRMNDISLEEGQTYQNLWETNKNFSMAFGTESHVEGVNCFAGGNHSHAEGNQTFAKGWQSHSEGHTTQALGNKSHAEGNLTIAKGENSHTEGYNTITYNYAEHASGKYNKSTQSSDTSKATHFSIGIGTSDTDRKNAFEVKQNGDIYINGL